MRLDPKPVNQIASPDDGHFDRGYISQLSCSAELNLVMVHCLWLCLLFDEVGCLEQCGFLAK